MDFFIIYDPHLSQKVLVSIYHAAFSGRNLNWDLDMLISIFGKMQINYREIHVKGQTNQVLVSLTLNTCILFVLKS